MYSFSAHYVKRLVFFCFLLSTFSGDLIAQTGAIRGKILDSHSGESIISATVILKGAQAKAAVSGLDGSFAIPYSGAFPVTIGVSFLGYVPQEIVVENASPVKVVLETDRVFLTEAVVVGETGGRTDVSARAMEKLAMNVLNVVSARHIESSPDLTVANVLQRVSGVSVEKSGQGEGRYPIIRGMNKQYSYTLVDGVKIPSPDDKNRYVPMDIFPSDLLERLEVSKSLTANMEGDAIGGTMNMVMKNAPEHFLFKANVATGYSQYLFNNPYYQFDKKPINTQSPAEIHGKDYWATEADFPLKNLVFEKRNALPDFAAGVTVGGRIGESKRLGLILGSSFQNFYRGTESIFFVLWPQPDVDNDPQFTTMRTRNYSSQQTRTGINAKADYRINHNNRLSISYLYVNLDQSQARMSVDTSLNHPPSRIGPGSGQVSINWRTRFQRQTVHNFALKGQHKIVDPLTANWSVAYATAKGNMPDQAQFGTTHDVKNNVATTQLLTGMQRRWLRTSDTNLDAKIDLTYTPFASIPLEIAGGGLYRHKQRDNYMNTYSLSARFVNGSEPQPYTGIENASYYFSSPSAGQGNSATANTYNTKENIIAFYGQLKFDKPNYEIILGVRNETTDAHYDTAMSEDAEGKYGSNSYSDLLPSINLKYRINNRQNLRASYYRGICRPGFFEVIPYNIDSETYDERGNPYLKHTVADNIDLRYEWFPTGIDQLLVGVFYKNIVNPIEHIIEIVSNTSLAIIPQNCGNAVNYGFEMVVAKYFRYFGVTLNYTFTQSSITTDKQYFGEDRLNAIVKETRPLQGQSKHIGNASLIFRHQPLGINVQLSGVFTGRRIANLSPFKGMDYWQDDYMQVDFSGEKRLSKNGIIFMKISNLMGTPLVETVLKPNTQGNFVPMQTNPKRMMVRKEVYQPTYQLGIRINLSTNLI